MDEVSAPLADLLRLAGWGPRQLVTAINGRLSRQGRDRFRLDPTAGYSWLRRGFRPRPPIPDVAESVLSERIGFTVVAAQLWPGRDGAGAAGRGAADNLDGITHVDDLLHRLGELSMAAATPQNPIVEASGADLTAAVLDQLHDAVLVAQTRAGHESVLAEQADLISTHVTALRRLDDRHGGGPLNLRYVTGELRNVRDLIEHANYDPKIGRRLVASLADLAQLLGWLHFDSSHYGASQRYLLLSVGICRALRAPDRAANAIGMLSYVSAFAGHGPEAVRLAEAADRECGNANPMLRARLLGRDATAAAADGDLARFRRQSEHAAELVSRGSRETPSFLYYLNAPQLAAERGQALVVLAERTTAHRQRLLDEAIVALRDAVAEQALPSGPGQGPAYPRSALLHTSFLAKAYLLHGDLPEAVEAMRTGLGLLNQVQSPRGRAYLRALRPALARRSRSPLVADFLPDFDRALSPV